MSSKESPDGTSSSKPSEAVLKALAILESFGAERAQQSLADISRRLGIPKASALRHLAALESAGYVVRHPGNIYALGARVLEPARAYLKHNELISSARPILDALAVKTGETAHLGVLQGPHVIYVAIAESPQRVRAYVQQGDRIPAHAVASGKAILAFSSGDAVAQVLSAGLERLSAHTITSAEAFQADLERTRARGFGLNLGEWIEEVSAAAAPIFSHSGDVVGAIGVAGPKTRLTSEKMDEIGTIVLRHADRLSARLGAPRRAASAAEGAQ